MIEESWVSKNKRKREYFNHVTNLDKIYTEHQQKKKIGETIDFLKRIGNSRQSTLTNERTAMIKNIQQENVMQEKLIKESGDHYINFVLRPQIGLKEHSLAYGGIGTASINHYAVQREHQQKKIQNENKKFGQRLHFISSSFTQEALKRKTVSLKYIKDESKPKPINIKDSYMNLDQIGVSSEYKNRTLKGTKFKNANDKLSLVLGKQADKKEIENMLAVLEERKKAYYSQFMPRKLGSKDSISQTIRKSSKRSDFDPSRSLPKLVTPSKSMYSSKDHVMNDELAAVVKHSNDIARKGREERAILKRRLIEEEEKSRLEFKALANLLFKEEVADSKMVQFDFEVKSTEVFTNFFVAVIGIQGPVNIGRNGHISIPWKSVVDNSIIELEFTTQQNNSERILFDISKRQPRITFKTLTCYQLSASVYIV